MDQAAVAQEKVDEGDSYVCHLTLSTGSEVIFTDQFLIVHTSKGQEWKNHWREIAYCEMTDYGIVVHIYGNDAGGKGTLIECDDINVAYNLYEQLLVHAHKMGNGSLKKPLDELLTDGDDDKEVGRELTATPSVKGTLDGYRFGKANGTVSNQIMEWGEACFCMMIYHLLIMTGATLVMMIAHQM